MPTNTHDSRLAALREELRRCGLDGFVVPISDEHMSEYIGAYAQRLAWLTGFGGSTATAVVMAEKAAIFIDGRYTLQVRDQVNGSLWDYVNVPEVHPATWIADNAPEGAIIGYDAWLHSRSWAKTVQEQLGPKQGRLVAVQSNPVDAIWNDRPAPSDAPIMVHDEKFAGKSSTDKRADLAEWLKEKACDTAVIAALDSTAWLLNIRGSDVERTPVALAFALAHCDGTADLFVELEKLTPEVSAHLGDGIIVRPRAEFVPALEALAGKRVAADPASCVAGIFAALETAGATIIETDDPCVLPKAIKNPVEVAGQRAAHVRDGAAVTRFLYWLSVEAPKGTVTELSAAEKLHQFRRETGNLHDLSFDTISGAGPNGAIVHYRVSEATNRVLEPNSVYLVDSGGQYRDGTTDITRTVWVGPDHPPQEVKDRFSRVLRGNLAVATQPFPKGTTGSQLDTLARQFLWRAGVDYAHGTGHGVGSFLNVHEGPQYIAKPRAARKEAELHPGMIISNEPGYYKTGAYGIRIENLVLVETRDIPGAEGEWLGFETITLAPIDRRLIDVQSVSGQERAWWDFYCARVWEMISPHVHGEVREWLDQQCAPL